MTQAFNLSQFANKLNTSGQTDNTGLQNSSVTVTAGTGMSGGGAVALGSSVTLTNAGVTSITNGGGLSISASTGAITITNSNTGTVTSVATGNGLSGGTITGSGTLTIAAPSFNTVGSYCLVGLWYCNDWTATAGSNYAAGNGPSQMNSIGNFRFISGNWGYAGTTSQLSGTWKWMTGTSLAASGSDFILGLGCRVS